MGTRNAKPAAVISCRSPNTTRGLGVALRVRVGVGVVVRVEVDVFVGVRVAAGVVVGGMIGDAVHPATNKTGIRRKETVAIRFRMPPLDVTGDDTIIPVDPSPLSIRLINVSSREPVSTLALECNLFHV
jgi:hypothetical protein